MGITLKLIRQAEARQQSFTARLVEDMIFARACFDSRLCQWIAHEMCEAVLRQEVSESFAYPAGMEDEFHVIARLVHQGVSEVNG